MLPPHVKSSLDLRLCLRRLLRLHKLRIVDEPVSVLVVRRQNGVDHVHKLVVREDLGFGDGLTTVVVVVSLICQKRKKKR